MRTVIYRKSDGFHAGTIPEDGTFEKELELNVLPNFKGIKENYTTLDVPYEYFKLEIINGEVVAVEIPPPNIPENPQSPSEIEILRQQVKSVSMDLETFLDFYFNR